MKYASFGICLLAIVCIGSSVKAQCGCSMPAPAYPVYQAPMPSHYAPMASATRTLPPPVASRPMGNARIAFVNKLATPVPRANYTLNYAVHLTDGRIC